MENTVKQTGLLEKTGVFDKELKNRYELHLTYNGVKGKRVLVICMNPASDNIQVFDSTTNYLLNNFGMMGYSDITVTFRLFLCSSDYAVEIVTIEEVGE